MITDKEIERWYNVLSSMFPIDDPYLDPLKVKDAIKAIYIEGMNDLKEKVSEL